MKKALIILIVLGFGLLQASVITAWDFEAQNAEPSTGNGSLSLIGGVSHDAYSGGYSGSAYAWSTTSYPAQGTNNRTAGLKMEVSTLGYTSISLSWAIRHSNKSANRIVLYYTLDRSAADPVWVEAGTYNATSGDAWFANSFDASGISGISHNPNLAFRFVTAFANAAGDAYVASNPSSNYAVDGKLRYDNMVLEGTPTSPHLTLDAELLPFYAAPGQISDIQNYLLQGTNLISNITISAPEHFFIRESGSASGFQSQIYIIPRNGAFETTIQVVFQPTVSGVFTGAIVHSGSGLEAQELEVQASTIKPEPSAYPTGFSATGITYYQAWLNWQDSSGAVVPDGYLIKGSKVSLDEIIAPVDGVPEADKKLTKNILPGVQTQLIYELNEEHTYYFRIFPYTNSGAAIDYKTDLEVPLLSVTTTSGPLGDANLLPGDIALVEYATDSPDRFSFVLLRDVAENTKIYFTDKAWTGVAFADGEDVFLWRGVGRSYLSGEVIHIEEGILHEDEGIYNPDFEGFSNSGDQIIAFQGYLTEPSFIAALSTTGWISSGIPGTNSSYLPETLVLGQTALGFSTEIDNDYYSGARVGSIAHLRTAINDPNNWTRQNSLSNITFPDGGFTLYNTIKPELAITRTAENMLHLSWGYLSGVRYSVYRTSNPDAAFPEAWELVEGNLLIGEYDLDAALNPQEFYIVVGEI